MVIKKNLLFFGILTFKKNILAIEITSDICRSKEFQCTSNNQCVTKSFVCDKENDCYDSSDEIGCGNKKYIFQI